MTGFATVGSEVLMPHAQIIDHAYNALGRPGGRVTNAVGTIFRKIFVGTRARPI